MKTTAINILLADDYLITRKGLAALIKKFDQLRVVAEAGRASEIIVELKGKQIDVILLNAMSEIAADDTFVSKIISEYPAVKIILFSIHFGPSDIQKFMALGVHGFISKHADIKEVKTAIKDVLEYGSYFSKQLTVYLQKEFMRPGIAPGQQLTDYNLTQKDMEVLKLMVQGLSSAEMGDILCLSKRTVEGRRRIVWQKTNTITMAELVQFAIRYHLLEAGK